MSYTLPLQTFVCHTSVSRYVGVARRPLIRSWQSRKASEQGGCRNAQTSRVAATQTKNSSAYKPSNAKQAVEWGLGYFTAGNVQEALDLFTEALTLNPSVEEARAALYNAACCYTKQKRWQEATDSVKAAVNDYKLKYTVALEDPDLKELRDRREWLDAVGEMRGGVSDNALLQLRAEAKAPFRLVRIVLLGGLLAGASVGLVIITARLIGALKGGEGAPDVTETLKNLVINAAAVSVLGFLVNRDLTSESRDRRVVEREEALGRLQIQVGTDRVVPLASLRGVCRPVLLAGNKGQVSRALKEAEQSYTSLRERGVCLVPLYLSEEDSMEKLLALKREFKASSSSSKGFGKERVSAPKTKVGKQTQKDAKWQVEPIGTSEWITWVATQKQLAGVSGDCVYVQVGLDGSVRVSGTGLPPWSKLVEDLPPLDDLRTKLMDGKGIMG